MSKANWKRYKELRPDQLAELVDEAPVAYWPLGLLGHHGWHLPVGFDPNAPTFSQMGEDARLASAERGEAGVSALVAHLTSRVNGFLKEGR